MNEYPDKIVILVDDDAMNLKILERFVEKYKVKIETFSSGFELLDRINEGSVCDLIITDDMMPLMSGTETLAKLKENPNFKIPTVVITGNTVEGAKEKYLRSGFDYYLEKPINKDELDKVMNMYLK